MKKVILCALLVGFVVALCTGAYADTKSVTVWSFSGLKDEDGTTVDQMILEVEFGRAFLQGYGLVFLSPANPSGTAVVSGAGFVADNGSVVFSLQMSKHLLIIAVDIVTTANGETLFGDASLYSPSGSLITSGKILLFDVQ